MPLISAFSNVPFFLSSLNSLVSSLLFTAPKQASLLFLLCYLNFHLSSHQLSDMDSNPYISCNFVDLLQSQQESSIGLESSSIPLFGTQASEGSNSEQESPAARTPRRAWTPTDDVVLISS